MCCGRTPMKTFLDDKPIWKTKIDQLNKDMDVQLIVA